jgi:large exoprotein involved in heme utilization and adhesion
VELSENFASPGLDEVVSSSLRTEADENSTGGNAGDIGIETGQLTVRDNAQVTVSSEGPGEAGNLEVQARNINLDQGQLRAETRSGNGGNIQLGVQNLLLMRNNSQISSTAGIVGAGGDSGNITISSSFLLAPPDQNSDITANAFSGSGGRVDITAQSVFGLEPRSRQELQTLLEPDEPLDPTRLPSNDITAISQTNPDLSGIVTFNVPDVDPDQGLVELPQEVVDASNQIASSCAAGGENQFTVTGRGGLPPSPMDPLSADSVLTSWATLDPEDENRSGAALDTNPTREIASTQIVEATGWVIDNKGEVVLTDTALSATLDIPWLPKSDCRADNTSS